MCTLFIKSYFIHAIMYTVEFLTFFQTAKLAINYALLLSIAEL